MAAHPTTHTAPWRDPAEGQVRVFIWEWPVRVAHWTMALSIVVLSITGYYMHSPYITARGYGVWVMGDMRFVHLLAAVAFMLAIATRIVWFFFGNRWVRINQYLPIAKERRRGIFEVAKYYVFLKWRPMSYIGHNPLAGFAYFVVYCAAVVEIITGMTLYSQTLSTPWIRAALGWIPKIVDIQYLREIHFCVMFFFWIFFMHHLYTAILVSIEERTGLMDSIFSGFKFVSREELEKETSAE